MFRSIERRVRDVIEERGQGHWPLTRAILRLLSTPYGIAVRSRAMLYHKGVLPTHRLPCKVIAIGNLTVGGTGKTPMTIYLARRLQQLGRRVAIISRGYKGSAERSGGVVSDGRHIWMGPEQAGDEPCMMAHKLPGVPILVGRDRFRSGLTAVERFKPEVILLDDGYQHLRLHRDLNILLLDARRPFGNGYLLPRGRLRESAKAANRADIVVYTRAGNIEQTSVPPVTLPDIVPDFQTTHQIYLSRFVPSEKGWEEIDPPLEPIASEVIRGKTVYAFSGIADNEVFQQALADSGMRLLAFKEFADHHEYSRGDLNLIGEEMKRLQPDWFATTEKDFYRLPGEWIPQMPMLVVGVEIAFIGASDVFDDRLFRLFGR